MEHRILQPHKPAVSDSIGSISVIDPVKGQLFIRQNGVNADPLTITRAMNANPKVKGNEFDETKNEISW